MKIFKVFKRQLAFELITLENKLIYRTFIVLCFKDTYKLKKDLEMINRNK